MRFSFFSCLNNAIIMTPGRLWTMKGTREAIYGRRYQIPISWLNRIWIEILKKNHSTSLFVLYHTVGFVYKNKRIFRFVRG
jgi:hypothetical protein